LHLSKEEQKWQPYATLQNWHESPLAQCTTPRITSIVMPAYDLGMKTAEHFLALQADPEHRPSMINLPYALDEHGSTAAPLSTD